MIIKRSEVTKKGENWIKRNKASFITYIILSFIVDALLLMPIYLGLFTDIPTRVFYIICEPLPSFGFGIFLIIFMIVRMRNPLLCGCYIVSDEMNKRINRHNLYNRHVEQEKAILYGQDDYRCSWCHYVFKAKQLYKELNNNEEVNYNNLIDASKKTYVYTTPRYKPSTPPKRKPQRKNHNWDEELDDDEYQELMEMMDEE